MIGNRAATAAYWLAALALSVLAGVGGATWGNHAAPTFSNTDKGGEPATGASRLLFSLGGGLFAGLAVLAVFAGIWMWLWVRHRRAHPEGSQEYEDDEELFDELEEGGDFDDSEDDEESSVFDQDGEATHSDRATER